MNGMNGAKDEIVPLILTSTLNIPMDIHLVCLHGLLESITDVDIDDVATLFSGMVMKPCWWIPIQPSIAFIKHIQLSQSTSILERSVWLCVTCMNTAMLMLSGKERRGGQEGCELAISFCEHFHVDDEQG